MQTCQTKISRLLRSGLLVVFLLLHHVCFSQTLNLPPRPAGAPTGTQFTNIIINTPSPTASQKERENWIYAQVISGNVPDWFRSLKPITNTASGHTAVYHVAPDYLAIGSDSDYFLMPTTPLLAQRLADRLGCTLPTRKMVGYIWTNAPVKLAPVTFNPGSPDFYDILSLAVFGGENAGVRAARDLQTNSQPLGALVGGDKKDVIISSLIYSNLSSGVPKPVVIYGWHRLSPYGSPIQGAVNVHEETYADYSHGTRLVQMNMIVDGSPNTVTNVLTSPTLATLLSDETIAPSFTIPLPRYTVAAMSPVVMTHPRGQSALPGTALTLNTLAIGDLPLTYRWQLNGVSIANATNESLTVSNLSAANSGNYSVIVSNATGTATSRVAVVRLKTSAFPVLFSDNFDTNSSVNWNLFWGAANGVPDYTVDWAFDYGNTPYTFNGVIALIPPAPNSSDGVTKAVKFTVNSDNTGAVAAVNIYPKNFSVSGNFALKFDMWMNYPGNAGGFVGGISYTGTTQHAIYGINHLGTNVNWAATTASASDGLWFAADGEGGTSADYRAYRGNLSGTQTDLTAAGTSGLVASNNVATLFQNIFPAARFETAGSPGKNWVEVEVRQTNNIIVWLMDGTVVAQRTNSSTFTNGNIMIGLMDAFSSIANPARDCFVLFDNLRVENLSPQHGFESVTRLADGQTSLVVTSALGDSLLLEASTNLSQWSPLGILNMTNQPALFVDTNAPGFPLRFYRSRR